MPSRPPSPCERAVVIVAVVVAQACSSPPPAPAGPPTEPGAGSGAVTGSGPTSRVSPPAAVASPDEIAAARASVVDERATLLARLGGRYLCDQRIYPALPGPHITAWEWSFTATPDEVTDQLASTLPGALREGRAFRFAGAQGGQGEPAIVVDVRDGTRSMLQCEVPPGTRALVVVSQR